MSNADKIPSPIDDPFFHSTIVDWKLATDRDIEEVGSICEKCKSPDAKHLVEFITNGLRGDWRIYCQQCAKL